MHSNRECGPLSRQYIFHSCQVGYFGYFAVPQVIFHVNSVCCVLSNTVPADTQCLIREPKWNLSGTSMETCFHIKTYLIKLLTAPYRLIFCKRYWNWTAEDWGKVIFSDESPFRLFGASGKYLVRRRPGELYHQSCVMPTVKHPETIHVCGCFSAKGVGSLTILPKKTAMN